MSALNSIIEILDRGHWIASVFHNPPRRGQPRNSILGAAVISVKGKFDSEDAALAAAQAVIDQGRPDYGTFVHRPTAKPTASFIIQPGDLRELGRLIALARAEGATP